MSWWRRWFHRFLRRRPRAFRPAHFLWTEDDQGRKPCVLGYDRVLSPEEVARVSDYLAAKYGLDAHEMKHQHQAEET